MGRALIQTPKLYVMKSILRFAGRFLTGDRPGRKNSFTSGVVVIGADATASVTYLLEPYLRKQGCDVTYVAMDSVPPLRVGGNGCHTVVIARYLPGHWIGPLKRFSRDKGRVVYFMDDDLMDPEVLVGLPHQYAKKIRTLAINQRHTLELMCDEFWVASPFLAQKYRSWKPNLLAPQPSASAVAETVATTVCYHGTASHQAEITWLVPVMTALQATQPGISFEIFGDHSVNRMFRKLPRVSILHPMTWPNYLAFTASVHRDIALAPLLPGPFNAGRGPTKFFDFARMGAVGIYTDVSPYRGFIRDGVDGVLLPNDFDLWLKTIVELAADAPRRERMAKAARQRALALAWDSPLVLETA